MSMVPSIGIPRKHRAHRPARWTKFMSGFGGIDYKVILTKNPNTFLKLKTFMTKKLNSNQASHISNCSKPVDKGETESYDSKSSENSSMDYSIKSDSSSDSKSKASDNIADEIEVLDPDLHQEKEIFIQDLSFKINELQEGFTQHRDPSSFTDRERPLILNNIMITPGAMIFKDAYDGKRFNQTLTITNCGKNSVTVRIFPPTSKAFKIKPVTIGYNLPAGLSLVRKIRYLYTKPTAIPQASMEIYINNNCLRYELLVVTCYTQISVSPKIIDFGEIDVGMVSTVKFLTITNSGSKQAQYSIDLGRNQMEVIVQPLKGTVQPGESKKVTVEVFGTSEGEFHQEFWIKTEPLQRVNIQGNFIEPTLKINYPWDQNFLILSFCKTFVGVKQQRNVVIKNYSSTSTVFCVMARTKDEKIPFQNAKEKDINYIQFDINPVEGRLHSDQEYVMGITFIPQEPKHRPNYYICSVIVDVKRCRVGNASKPKSSYHDMCQNVSGPPLLDSVSIVTLDDQNELEREINSFNDTITIVLYGEVEIPQITIEPDKFYLYNIKVNDLHLEDLKILNHSKTLPLVLKYNKVAYVEVEPKVISLPPNEEVSAVLRLKPTKMGEATANITFDAFYRQYENVIKVGTVHLNIVYSAAYAENQKLLKLRKPYFVPGITPLVTNEVGYQVEDVRFNSKIEKPIQAIVDKKFISFDKNNDALIAFPNDRPKCLRPWRNTVPCNTIFAKLPRIVTKYEEDYDLTTREKYLQETTQSYYKKYIKSLSLKHSSKNLDESFEDYVTTNQKLILMENIKSGVLCPPVLENVTKQSLFVPLTPYQLHKLIVTPKFIQLGMLAAHTDCSNYFNIENKNDFPVHVCLKALYSSIAIHQEQFILAPNSQKNINFTYHSDSSGTNHIPMFVILNFFHVIDVTVLATIVSNTVKCLTKELLIVPSEKTAFLELRNDINSDVRFVIDTTFFHLESYPSSGVIPAKKNMACTITFNPEIGYMPVKEIAVISGSGAKELVEVHFDRSKASVGLSTDNLVFNNVPLNTAVSKELTIRNNSDQLVPVNIEIENSELFPEICINPMKALLWQKGDIVITFTLKFTEVVQFTLPIKVIFQYEFPRKITVSGNVVFPEVNFSPELIKIQKISSGSKVKAPFKVNNLTEVTNFLSFPMHDYPEFEVKTKTGENVTNRLTLAPNEKKELYLEFLPREPVAYCIYLPYIINGVIGPPELNRPSSLKCSEYLSQVKNAYKTSHEVSSKLKVVKILCAAGKNWLSFSCLEMNFSSFDPKPQEFEVTNISNTIHEITFKKKKSEYFNLTPTNLNMAIVDENFKTILEPRDSFKMSIEFLPIAYGTYNTEVSIYIKEYSEIIAFNSIKLYGSNPVPEIKICSKLCYFLPTYIGSRLEKPITLNLDSHKCNGDIQVDCEDPHIDVWYLDREVVSPLTSIIHYTVVFAPKENCAVETKIKFSCQCNASTEMEVYACGDTALVINFMAYPNIIDQSTYPFYPQVNDKSEYAVSLHSIVPIIERWLYSQAYIYQNYYKIPDDIARYPVNTEGDKKMNTPTKKVVKQLPLVTWLINLMDPSILKYIDNGLLPSEDLKDRTLYNYVTYRNTISFLKSQGIFVPGLKPEHLLPYTEYIELKSSFIDKERPPTEENFSEEEFYRFSKQKWLDLFFHIYKVLVLERVVDPKPFNLNTKGCDYSENEFIINDREACAKYFRKNKKRFSNWFLCETKLLLWLEYHYNRQKAVLWPDEAFESYEYLDDFSNINDSVALATITAAYCPYLIDKLKDIYFSPKKLEHKVHNACRVVQAWKSLKLSLDFHPQTIVTGHQIKILLIVTYLYEVLPHYYPTNDVTIEAPLSERSAYELTVSNCGDVSIKYEPLFFGKGSELFKLDSQQIVIPAKKSKKIKLTYFAKRVLQASIILVLSGEASGQRYARSMAVTVNGIPITSECKEIKIQVETYKSVKRTLALQTPYGTNYTAKIYMCFGEPKSYKDYHSVSLIKAKSIPREVTITEDECTFVDKGDTTIVLEMCFLSQGPISFYLCFCNNDIGDFCVLFKLTSQTKPKTAKELCVKLPDNYMMKCSCRSGFSVNCPKAFRVDIPCRNYLLWKSVNNMLESCFGSRKNYTLFKTYFGTPLVFRLLKFYLDRFPEGFMLTSCIFDDQAEFKISPSKKYSIPRSTFKIPDVTSEDPIPLLFHWDVDGHPTDEIMELKNTNEKEVRYFKLIFPKEKSINSYGSGISKSSRSTKNGMENKTDIQ